MKQVCIDFSEVVISLMRSRHNDKPGIEWRVADVREMSMAAESVDVAFDKGTLDAMIYGSE
jgi:ubiquinone/menaquinone biosynthesis C-methylase UbiE